MGYSVKWVADNLGITRDMLRYYEKEKLLPIVETRNPSNKWRDYSEEDIERIWGIKLLISIGFSAKEIRAFESESEFDFLAAISKKVEELEKRYDEIQTALGFAKTIQMTGRIPNVKQVGAMRFDDFISFARENWNAFNDPQTKKYVEFIDATLSKPDVTWQNDDILRAIEIYGDMEPELMEYAQTTVGYYRVLTDMMRLGYKSEAVQCVVKCMYDLNVKMVESPHKDKFTPEYFAECTIPSFMRSGMAKLNERVYGKDGCAFIAKALAYFAGFDFELL